MTTNRPARKPRLSTDLVHFVQERVWRLDRNAHAYRDDFTSYIVDRARMAVTAGWFVPEDRIEELIRRTDPDDPAPNGLSTVRAGPAWKETHAALRALVREVDTGITPTNYQATEEQWRRRYVPMFSGRYAILLASDSLRRATADVIDDARLFRRRILRFVHREVPIFQSGHAVDSLLVSALLAREWPRSKHRPYAYERSDREGAVTLAVFGPDHHLSFAPERWALRALCAGANVRRISRNRRLTEILSNPPPTSQRRVARLRPLLIRAGLLRSRDST